jgi:hypothetical protein
MSLALPTAKSRTPATDLGSPFATPTIFRSSSSPRPSDGLSRVSLH